HHRDSWISAAATSWAVLALTQALPVGSASGQPTTTPPTPPVRRPKNAPKIEFARQAVPRWVNVRQRWDRPKAALVQEVRCGGADRLERRQGVGRGDHLGRLEDVPDVVVAGDDPVIKVGAVEDRGGGPCLGEEGVRVGQVRIMKGIEPPGEVLRLAGPRAVALGSFGVIDPFLPKGLPSLLSHDVLFLLSHA